MDYFNSTDELLKTQYKLLEQMNGLIERQNKILQSQPSATSREVFVNDIDHDEMRSGFLVTSDRKKLWNVQIGLINEFARICKKHNMKWWAIGGTLLGAARHSGFIPWDDDVDVVMFRPDYEKFRAIVQEELQNEYFLYAWYNYRLESDEHLEEQSDPKLPLISIEQHKKYPFGSPFFPLIRIIDKRTTMMGFDDRKNFFTGIFIDILCFDPVPPFTRKEQILNYEMAKELFYATVLPDVVKKNINQGQKFILPNETLNHVMNLPYQKRAEFWESFMGKIFSDSERIYHLKHLFYLEETVSYATEDFEKTVYLPFEQIEIPCPSGYDRVLSDKYGDWHKFIFTHAHSAEWSADIPYTEYYEKSALMRP